MRLLLERGAAAMADTAMCAMMNLLQWRLRHGVCTAEELNDYLTRCEALSREEFYRYEPVREMEPADGRFQWDAPQVFGGNGGLRAVAELYPAPQGWKAPTVFLLHALMSAGSAGYIRLARHFNAMGWNAVFPHLPYHYSRVPEGHFNGALAMTANLIRNGETLRMGVVEIRQLMDWFRARGCREFGLLGTSYGGWMGALTSFLEPDFRFVALIQPIVNIEHAIWMNPSAFTIRRALEQAGIPRGASTRHAHLSSPLHGAPLCGAEKVFICAGSYDTVSPPAELRKLAEIWNGAQLIETPQGHFGYRALKETMARIEPIARKQPME